jgi:hypothetical protein
MKDLYKILVIIIIVLLSLPAIQYFTNFPRIKPLQGVYVESNPVFNLENYLNFEFQKEAMTYIDQNFGYRPDLIRFYNQFMFSFFNQSQGNGVVVGKDQYLYEFWFIDESMGGNFMSWEDIIETVDKVSVIRNFLKNYDTELLVVLAPGKSYYYPEYVPDYYQRKSEYTNYSRFANYFHESDVPTFDVNKWFMKLKGSEKAPLFPKTGTHWSYYGAELAADSILGISEQLLNRKLNRFSIESLEWSKNPKGDDIDLERLSNLIFPIKQIPHAYPKLKHNIIDKKEDRPNMTVIADSFFWLLFDNSLNNSFKNIWYWYYYNSVFPNGYFETVNDLNVDLQIKNTDMVMLLATTAGLYKFGYGFVEDAYELAIKDQQLRQSTIDEITNEIFMSETKLKEAKKTAEIHNISIDSAINLEATNQARIKLKAQFYQPDYPLK